MQPPPKGDPNFSILGPSNNDVLGPDFSVYGWGPQNLRNVVAWVGSQQQTANLQPHPDLAATNWEAIFTGVTGGTYGVFATDANNGRTPASPGTVTVTVDANPGVTIAVPTAPMTMGAGDPQTNPWDGWKVAGTYDPAKISGVEVYLTRRGISFWGGARGRIHGVATLNPSTRGWTCDLNFMPASDRGQGFLAHYVATRTGGGTVHGSITGFFDGPTSSADE